MADDRASMLADIGCTADALTDAHDHVEVYEVWDASRHRKLRRHVTRVPGLLVQVRDMVDVMGAGDDGGKAPKPEGSPAPLNLEAASLLLVVTIAAFRWCNRLDVEQRATVEDNVRALVGAAGQATSDQQAALLHSMRSWHRRSSILTGWETPPFRPNVVCPWCERRGTLVVNLAAKSAFCANEECDGSWAETAGESWGSIYDLGEHIRAATQRDEVQV